MSRILGVAVFAFGTIFAASTASPACDVDKPGGELSGEEAQAVYECLAADMLDGYKKGNKRWVPAEFVNDISAAGPRPT